MSITFIFFERNNIKLYVTFVQYLQFKGIQNFCKYEHFYKLLYRIFKKQDYKTLLTGKIQILGEDYTYLTNLAKECLVNRRDIYFLESSLRGYKNRVAELKAELAELKSKCKPFLEALAIAPKKVMEFIGIIIKPKYKPTSSVKH